MNGREEFLNSVPETCRDIPVRDDNASKKAESPLAAISREIDTQGQLLRELEKLVDLLRKRLSHVLDQRENPTECPREVDEPELQFGSDVALLIYQHNGQISGLISQVARLVDRLEV